MIINVIDYRGVKGEVINTKGETLYDYRTRYFKAMQDDFKIWKEHGHTFRCWTQHQINDTDFTEFDDVIEVPRGNASESRNRVLDAYPIDEWVTIWDNDATLYFKQLHSRRFVEELDKVLELADERKIRAFIPFNPQQSPYPKVLEPDFTFKPTLELKGTMFWVKNTHHRFDVTLPALEDHEFAWKLVLDNYRVARLQELSLKEYAMNTSTIFEKKSSNEESRENRKLIYKNCRAMMEKKLGISYMECKELHNSIWVDPVKNTFDELFVI